MLKELTLTELNKNPLITSIHDNASNYGVNAQMISYKIDSNKADSGYYIVAGLGKFPEYNNPKEIENRQLRNVHLFHPKEFAIQLTEDNLQFAIEELYNYCQRAEMISCLYREYDCPIPDVMRMEELFNLYKFNKGWNNPDYDVFLRRENKNALDEYFEDEKKANKSSMSSKWRDYYRSNNYDPKKSRRQFIMQSTFNKEIDQNISFELLSSSCSDISRIELTEAEYQQLRTVLKDYPEITYSAAEKEVIDHGEIKTKNPADNPFYGEQSRFEFRDLCFKTVDEPVIMGQVYKMRWNEYAEHRATLIGELVAKRVSYNNIHNFVSLANANNLKFAIDIKGEFKKASTEFVPVLFKRNQLYLYNAIMDRINYDKTQYHSIENSNLPYLADNIQRAEAKQIEDSSVNKTTAISRKKYDPEL